MKELHRLQINELFNMGTEWHLNITLSFCDDDSVEIFISAFTTYRYEIKEPCNLLTQYNPRKFWHMSASEGEKEYLFLSVLSKDDAIEIIEYIENIVPIKERKIGKRAHGFHYTNPLLKSQPAKFRGEA